MITSNPYLHFSGLAENAMHFYKKIFGGEFAIFQRYKDVFGGEKMLPEDQEKMIHISLKVNSALTIMASDLVSTMGQNYVPGNNFHICIHTESEKDADKMFGDLSEGGKVEMPMNKTFWGAYFGMCRDKFGIYWMINYDYPKA